MDEWKKGKKEGEHEKNEYVKEGMKKRRKKINEWINI
jgi:hypothetical protein